MTHKEEFIQKYWQYALLAEQVFGINPIIILAQAAHESAGDDGKGNWLWGNSYSAKNRKNLFGITAGGSPNPYWQGEKSPSTVNPHLTFRIYSSIQNGILDFARLIKTKYPTAFSQSYNVKQYANAIAYSPYIDVKNGDNPVIYESSIIKNAAFIENYVKANRLPTRLSPQISVPKTEHIAIIWGTGAVCTLLIGTGIWVFLRE